jgi:hypothetical protein
VVANTECWQEVNLKGNLPEAYGNLPVSERPTLIMSHKGNNPFYYIMPTKAPKYKEGKPKK